MPERQQDLGKSPDRSLDPALTTADKLVLARQGRLHFEEAVEIASKTEGYNVMNALVGVAVNMANADVPPISALERLMVIRDSLPVGYDQKGINTRAFMELGMADIYGMLGRHAEMKSLTTDPKKNNDLRIISSYVYAGEEHIRRGEDPTSTLTEAMDRIAKSETYYDNHFGKVIEYARIGKVFHKAGLDQRVAFSKAEDEITRAKQYPHNFDNRSCLELATSYAQCGYFDDALRMAEELDIENAPAEMVAEYRDRKVREILNVVLDEQLAQGDMPGAIETAKRLGSPRPMVRAFAHKAVFESDRGIDPSSSISESLRIAGSYSDPDEPDLYEEAYPLVGLALAKYGKKEEAKEMFSGIRSMIEDTDLSFRPDAGFALARAMDEAGYDATEIFEQSFNWADEAREKGELYWDVYEVGIRSLIERGNFDLAKEYMDKYIDGGWPKSRLLSELANAEAKRGLSQEQINNLSPEEIREILRSPNELASQAVVYFELENKLL